MELNVVQRCIYGHNSYLEGMKLLGLLDAFLAQWNELVYIDGQILADVISSQFFKETLFSD